MNFYAQTSICTVKSRSDVDIVEQSINVDSENEEPLAGVSPILLGRIASQTTSSRAVSVLTVSKQHFVPPHQIQTANGSERCHLNAYGNSKNLMRKMRP